MKILNSLLAIFAPDICLGCGQEGASVCVDCVANFTYPDQCLVCKRPSLSSLTCAKCKSKTTISALYVVSTYKDLAKDLVWQLKYRPNRATSDSMSKLMEAKLPYLEQSDAIITHIPTTPDRVRERGFDQSKELAKRLAWLRRLPYIAILRRTNKSHQVGSSRIDRLEHMKNAFNLKNSLLVAGKTVVVIDDVYTTGSTMESACKLIKQAGAKRVMGLVFARTE